MPEPRVFGSGVIALLLMVGPVTLWCAESPATTPTASATLQVTLQVNGMTCLGCVAGVEAALRNVQGVRQVAVSLERNEAVVDYDPTQADTDALVAAVREAGFHAVLNPADASEPAGASQEG